MTEFSLNPDIVIGVVSILLLLFLGMIGIILIKDEEKRKRASEEIMHQREVKRLMGSNPSQPSPKTAPNNALNYQQKSGQNLGQSRIGNISQIGADQVRAKPEISNKQSAQSDPEEEGLCPHGYSNPNVDCPMCYDAPDDDDD